MKNKEIMKALQLIKDVEELTADEFQNRYGVCIKEKDRSTAMETVGSPIKDKKKCLTKYNKYC